MSVTRFLEKALFKIESMTPEEVLYLHEEAQRIMQDPIVLEGYEGVLFINDKEEIRSDTQK